MIVVNRRQQLATEVAQRLQQCGTNAIIVGNLNRTTGCNQYFPNTQRQHFIRQLDDIAAHPESLSGAQLLYRARRIAACWLAAGCGAGDTVLLFSELRVDAVAILIAGLLSGVRVAVLEHTADLRKTDIERCEHRANRSNR